MAIWTKQDIWQLIKKQGIPYSIIYDKGEQSTGCAYCAFGLAFDPMRFHRLRKLEPKRFAQMMKIENNGVTYKEALCFLKTGQIKSLFDEYE